MFKLFASSKLQKLTSRVLNSKTTYIILFLVILAQFLLVSIIFFRDRQASEILNDKLNFMEGQQAQLDNKLNILQSNLMRMTAQLYRLEGNSK